MVSEIEYCGLPKHIAIIMDGNGRWAKKRGLPRVAGHKAGMEALRKVVRACSDIGIRILTVYAFSTENWKRPKDEVSFLMNLLLEYMRKETAELHSNNVRIKILGDIGILSEQARNEIGGAVKLTEANTGLQFNIALNYGGRREIVMSVRRIAEMLARGELLPGDIDEQLISGHLYTAGDADPDLIIRTSGEQRLSNFLLWQSAYSELYFSEELWPDFNKESLMKAIREYTDRDRRFGALK